MASVSVDLLVNPWRWVFFQLIFSTGAIFCPALGYLEGMMGGMCPDPAGLAAFFESVTLLSPSDEYP